MPSANSPEDVRWLARTGKLTGPTSGLAPGFTQANLVILPREEAFPFLLFCQRNPRPCPVLEVTEPGDPVPRQYAPSADLRTDLPRYRIWRDGELAGESTDITDLWRDDFVSFLIGCSFTFEAALLDAGLPVRHIEQGCNVPMYRTSIACTPARPFAGNLVVSMRPFLPPQAIQAVQITSRFPAVHGAPVHFGDPAQIGITDLSRPDFGDAVDIRQGETPVFWACGVTPQVALLQARLPLAITHSPGCMFVSDRRDAELAGL
ncbi:MAG: putative hydro-lyase [Maioricimonas sp. JB049]